MKNIDVVSFVVKLYYQEVFKYVLLFVCSVEYKTFNILEDNDVSPEISMCLKLINWSFILYWQQVREGLKKFSNWPTYPQVYVDGELVGGFDIIKVIALEKQAHKYLLHASTSVICVPEFSVYSILLTSE